MSLEYKVKSVFVKFGVTNRFEIEDTGVNKLVIVYDWIGNYDYRDINRALIKMGFETRFIMDNFGTTEEWSKMKEGIEVPRRYVRNRPLVKRPHEYKNLWR